MAIAFIQARLSSTRLPGKVLKPIGGKPMIWHLWWRLSQAESIDKVVVATSDLPSNDPLEAFCLEAGIPCFRGSEENVLDRIYQAARFFEAKTIVCATGDCPLIDPWVADRVIKEYRLYGPDLCAVSPSFTYPDGFGTVIFSMNTLEKAHQGAESDMEKEHLTLYMQRHPELFSIRFVEYETYHPFTDLHLSVDDEDDFKLVERIFNALLPENELFSLEDIIKLLLKHPEWVEEHPSTPINEGYFKSLFADKKHRVPEVRPISLEKSQALFKRSQKRIPSCTQTFSKGYTQFVQGVSPIFIERGEGAVVYDTDGNDFIDYPLALGAVTIGHCHPVVDAAVIEQVKKSPSHTLPHPLEVEVAERLCEIIPCAEKVRFGKNGSDATSGAVRVARALTGRDKIACCGYHGWQDWYIGTTLRNRGVPKAVQELTLTFPYNDLPALEALFEQHADQIAAVIMEPVGVFPHAEGYLEDLKTMVHHYGALLIFDEVVTGFRLAPGGAQQYFGVTPDIACVGKGMANGYPISAVVGPSDIMEEFDRSFFSFTFGGEAVSLAAVKATLNVMVEENVISHMWIMGRKLKDGFNYLARLHNLEGHVSCMGLPPKAAVVFEENGGAPALAYKALFQQECARRGVLFNGNHAICLMHTDEQIEYTIGVYDEALKVLENAYAKKDPESFLSGPMIEPVFRKMNY